MFHPTFSCGFQLEMEDMPKKVMISGDQQQNNQLVSSLLVKAIGQLISKDFLQSSSVTQESVVTFSYAIVLLGSFLRTFSFIIPYCIFIFFTFSQSS